MHEEHTQSPNTFTLADLNQLSSGLGDKIQRLMESHTTFYRYCEVRDEVTGLLKQLCLETKDVYVERGLASRLTVDEAFGNFARNYQFRDQWG